MVYLTGQTFRVNNIFVDNYVRQKKKNIWYIIQIVETWVFSPVTIYTYLFIYLGQKYNTVHLYFNLLQVGYHNWCDFTFK